MIGDFAWLVWLVVGMLAVLIAGDWLLTAIANREHVHTWQKVAPPVGLYTEAERCETCPVVRTRTEGGEVVEYNDWRPRGLS